ncbi:trans-L-3-hydroxyproline dehydratase-like [Stegodyphus dumicola]|uniref:trans-L-3-hydroxyproline dehydratase-like n=1 Tax=Stegodyphus dumicola TaxID=202533 RepID=UPI0015ADEC10|nr:trans-L-3-hydroxyproline dehydratase-like [Stegodyphus dumicola]
MTSCGFESALVIETHDMHTAGEPLRIVEKFPSLEGSTVLEKRKYVKTQYDYYRRFLMTEPRGHNDMYGAILIPKLGFDNEFEVIFMHNEGYSSMCGHGVIALGRYVVDQGLVSPSSPETEIIFHCPCGPVKTYVQYNNGVSGPVRFQSMPAFLYKSGAKINVKNLGSVEVDIAYGGAFYAFVSASDINVDLDITPLSQLVDTAAMITEAAKEQLTIKHPESDELSFLYGTIITDGKDKYSESPTKNICVFADKQVDRSPTGSGVTARIALQFKKGLIALNQPREFKSIIDTSFTGKAVSETKFGNFDAVVVEVCGMSYHIGKHVFYMESNDPLNYGFLLPN